ncbi:antitoxin HicB [Alkalihalobacillus alcalophilus ATCC 27647 = CGMCC 1.3604]|uniref:Antitoxin HicB n=1 Tax=Alkalihalobacillus alcalophilus ATCC 27647 = CGMCC 1.3604 TaxID=1218173 RepID=A0A094YX59_ALKAL|nr:type II toxin-antitoxin system HicB family antitoxin [Alkalihalobacillus alcalophilus]KGA98117.1 antitoxin HicB [Alkalihalobacillus alcalophilus ATCC 27647 = CGMCC 1.3604]MED1561457.1 type II toxin-antitoxin system HicB family antitoxin [Alkalihalobacillus alcalophilus]THG89292.1 antitoxin HicB [Alkalihalobacillus alcalophilus ATCC 27647 = CGMCC 1.3604]
MPVYKYYSVIHKEDGAFIVSFPDLENVFTDGESLSHAVSMAEDVLALMLTDYEDDGKQLPPASPVTALKAPEGASLVLIEVNTDEYRKAV